jgi:hypothetical protein
VKDKKQGFWSKKSGRNLDGRKKESNTSEGGR